MRLSIEEVQVYKENANRDMLEGTENRYEELLLKRIIAMADTIEAQHDEIESLKNWNACEAEEHERLIESDKRRIELEEEVERQEKAIHNIKAYLYDKEKEIERLQAQATAMREVLDCTNARRPETGYFAVLGNCKKCGEQIPYAGLIVCDKCYGKLIDNALSTDAGKDYHNPADVEALKKAREAFQQVQYDIDSAECREDLDGIKGYIDEALAEINKAIGGESIDKG